MPPSTRWLELLYQGMLGGLFPPSMLGCRRAMGRPMQIRLPIHAAHDAGPDPERDPCRSPTMPERALPAARGSIQAVGAVRRRSGCQESRHQHGSGARSPELTPNGTLLVVPRRDRILID